MGPDLYAVLEVNRTARKSTIVKAFRRLARKRHPDCGGDAVKFEQLKRAYEVLSDPIKRKRYDETGEVGSTNPSNELAEISGLLAAMWLDTVAGLMDRGQKPYCVDISKIMSEKLDQSIQAASQEISRLTKRKAEFEKLVGRWVTTADNPNPFEAATQQVLGAISRGINDIEAAMTKNKQAWDFLKVCKYEFEKGDSLRGFVDAWSDSSFLACKVRTW